jgi:hypothetical protein
MYWLLASASCSVPALLLCASVLLYLTTGVQHNCLSVVLSVTTALASDWLVAVGSVLD